MFSMRYTLNLDALNDLRFKANAAVVASRVDQNNLGRRWRQTCLQICVTFVDGYTNIYSKHFSNRGVSV